MPPPHLAVLNAQDPDDKPPRPRLGWLRAAVAPPPKPSRVPGLVQRDTRGRGRSDDAAARDAVAQAPRATEPAAQLAPPAETASPEAVSPSPNIAGAVAPYEDLLADLPPAQVPLRLWQPASSPAQAQAEAQAEAQAHAHAHAQAQAQSLAVTQAKALTQAKVQAQAEAPPPNGAAERAFRIGRQGSRPAHAMSALEIAAWRQGAMEAGRARDPIIGMPRLWWWLALSAVLVLPIAYAGGWLGMASNGAEFLSTRLGQEAWIIVGGPEAAVLYWIVIYALAMLLQMARPLEPVLILGAATWWGWTGLHAAWIAGWLAQRIPPLPMP